MATITLTVQESSLNTFEGSFQTLHFDSFPITIGSSPEATLCLLSSSFSHEHIKIVEIDGSIFLFNLVNDPFTSLNSIPFRKKRINNGDILQVGNSVISIEISETIQEKIQEEKIRELLNVTFNSKATEQETQTVDLEVLLRELDELPSSKTVLTEASSLSTPSPPPPPVIPAAEEKAAITLPIKDDYLKVYEEGEEAEAEAYFLRSRAKTEARDLPPSSNYWQAALTVSFALLFVCLVSIGSFLRADRKSEEDELKAAQGVSDIAMALNYASMHQIKAPKQNYNDPGYIQELLASITPTGLSSVTKIDAQGHFHNTPYFLRIYSTHNLSQFVLIAQPIPGFSQWLQTKTALVVDSKSMEMRRIKDLKSLNRILSNSSNLDPSHALEVSRIIEKGEKIPLDALTLKGKDMSFSLPLEYREEASDSTFRIYNAPRYYRIGEELLRTAISLLDNPHSTVKMSDLQQSITFFSHFPSLILYSANGKLLAEKAEKALTTFAPNLPFTMSYLDIHPTGKILKSFLLPKMEVFLLPEEDIIAMKDAIAPLENEHLVGEKHPLSFQISALDAKRKASLKNAKDPLLQLINDHVSTKNINEVALQAALADYIKLAKAIDAESEQTVLSLLNEHRDLSHQEFLAFLGAEKLQALIPMLEPQPVEENFAALMKNIESSRSVSDLYEHTKLLFELLSFQNVGTNESLIAYQAQLKEATQQKLEQFLLSPDSLKMNPEDRLAEKELLEQILLFSWINDPNEQEYFLNEWDYL